MAATLATRADVLAIAPELSTVDADLLTEILAEAALHLPEDAWGDNLSHGHRLLTAHFATLMTPSGAAVASRTLDKLSESYAVSAADGFSDRRGYGQRYARLLGSLSTVMSVPNVVTGCGWELPDGRIL